MGAYDRGVEHLDEMRRAAQTSKRLEEGFEDPRLAQAPETLPDRVPGPELGRQSPPGDVVQRKVVQGLQELAVIAALVAAPRTGRPKENPVRSWLTRTGLPCTHGGGAHHASGPETMIALSG